MTKRTRGRPRPKPVEVQVVDQTELDLAELSILWPQLEEALARDAAGPSAASTGSGGGGAGSPAVINLDVEQARAELATGIERIAAEAERILNLGRGWRPSLKPVRDAEEQLAKARLLVERAAAAVDHAKEEARRRWTQDALDQMGIWYVQLRNRQQPLADHITADVQRWHRVARKALRLRSAEQPLDWRCPHHRDEPTELIREADEAILSDRLLSGRGQRLGDDGKPIEAPLTWRRADSVYCPRCKKRWAGMTELRVLMRMIEQADAGGTVDEPEQPTCECRCHVSSGTHISCDVDAGYGVGCGPHQVQGG